MKKNVDCVCNDSEDTMTPIHGMSNNCPKCHCWRGFINGEMACACNKEKWEKSEFEL